MLPAMLTRSRFLAAVSASLALISMLPPRPAEAPMAAAGATPVTATQDLATQDKENDPESAATCGKCHTEIHKEWKGSMHADAWTDELYQAKIKKKRRPRSCYPCHIPERVIARIPRRAKTRKKLLHEGITCVSCHEHDGKMLGPYGSKTDAHETEKSPHFTEKGSNALCLTCHATKIDVVLPVGRDFEEAGLADQGKSCVGCHMAPVERHMAVSMLTGKPTGEKRKGRSHHILGPNDKEFLREGFGLKLAKTDNGAALKIENKAGHGVPGLKIREFHFTLSLKNAAGKEVGKQTFVVNHENGLKVGETRQFAIDKPAGVTAADLVFTHHFNGKQVAEVSKEELTLE